MRSVTALSKRYSNGDCDVIEEDLRVAKNKTYWDAYPFQDGDALPFERTQYVVDTSNMIRMPVGEQNSIQSLASDFSHDFLTRST